MKLPPEVQFHEDIRLLIWRPGGSIDEAAINKIIGVIEDIEAATQEPFNRFSDTSATHEVEAKKLKKWNLKPNKQRKKGH
jgi:hypothetical protein